MLYFLLSIASFLKPVYRPHSSTFWLETIQQPYPARFTSRIVGDISNFCAMPRKGMHHIELKQTQFAS